jgi:hypothetical protein
MAAGIDRHALDRAFPGVDCSRVAVWAAARWFVALWGRDVGAVALPWGIYLRSDLAANPAARLAPLIIHELAHVEQWRRLGPLRFMYSYLGGYLTGRRSGLGHRRAYLAIPLEEWARASARKLSGD